MADLRISELVALAGVNLAGGDLLPVVDTSAGETKKITVLDAIGYGITLINDATIPGAKIIFNAGTLNGSALATGTVGTNQLTDDGVTAAKLADESTVDLVTTLPASGAYVGQLALDTDDDKLYCWTGSAWDSIKAAGSVNTVLGDTAGIVNLSVATSGDTVTITTSLDNTSGAAQFLAGPTASAGAVGYRQIASGDLPTASSSGKGGVAVNGSGLAMSGEQIVIDNTVAASGATFGVVQYSNKGLVTSGRAITSADLPAATSVDKGAVTPGTGLAAGVAGALNHSNSVTAGTATKVTFDAQGHITATQALLDTDIPSLPASKITSGTLGVNLLGTNAITGAKLADSSTVQFGGAANTAGVVTFPVPDFKGQQFFDALNGDLYLFDGAAWQPITITAGELIYAGTYNANLNQVKSTTAAGTAAGLVVGNALPAASASNLRYYVVVADSGTGVAPAPVTALAPPDMLVSSGTAWELIDVSNGIAGQLASNISFTPSGNIAATDVQAAIQELDNEKLAKVGGTITGALEIGTAGSLVFEGSTADAYETTLTVVDPTADRSISLPDASGTLLTTGSTSAVTSAMIVDGTIVDGDINASAAIAGTKVSPNFGSQNILTTGNAGIGTAVPGASLEVVAANSAGASTVARFRHDNGADQHYFDVSVNPDTDTVKLISSGSANGSLVLGTAAVDTLTTTSAGNVGIGTTSPGVKLEVFGASNANEIRSSDGTIISQWYQDINGYGVFGTVSNHPQVFRTNSSERARIDSSGNVGIGTSSPEGRLSVAVPADGYTSLANTFGVSGPSSTGLYVGTHYDGSGAGCDLVARGYSSTLGDFRFVSANGSYASPVERARIDSSGRLLVGTSSARANFFNSTFSSALQVEGLDSSTAVASVTRSSADSSGPIVHLAKQRSGSIGGNSVVNNADQLGILSFQGNDGSEFVPAAYIEVYADGTPGANDMPGRLVFSTTADGAATPTEYLRIASTGAFGLSGANYGTSGQVLTSSGSGAAPTWTTVAGGGGGDVFLASANAFTGANTFTNTTGQTFRPAATQDGILLRGRAGGTTSRTVEIIPTTLTASRVLTAPDVSGTIVTTGDTGSVTSAMIAATTIVDGDINASAAIAHSKLANIPAGYVLLGNPTNVPTATAVTGDIGISNSGVTSIQAGVIVNADVNASAAIAGSKISPNFGAQDILNTSRYLLGHSSSVTTGSVQPAIQVQGTADNTSTINAGRWSASALGSGLLFSKSRGTSIGTRGAVTTNDFLGQIEFYGDNGTTFSLGAAIYANVDGTVSGGGAADMPGRLGFATSPDGSATPQTNFLIDKNGQLYGIVPGGTSTLYAGYFARAWVNFNGTGTVAIRASGNVTSITDNGVGAYTVNLTTAMPDANYAILATSGDGGSANYNVAQTSSTTLPTTSAFRIQTLTQNSGNPAATDHDRVSAAIFR